MLPGLTQRPTLTVPTLMAGQQSTLICTAPGLCSGSDPKITWSWRGNGGNISYSTADETGTLTPVTKRYSSALTLNTSVDNHGNSVTCEVSFRGDLKAAETAVLNVTCECMTITCCSAETINRLKSSQLDIWIQISWIFVSLILVPSNTGSTLVFPLYLSYNYGFLRV